MSRWDINPNILPPARDKSRLLNFFRKKPKAWNFTLISGPPLLVEKGGEPRRENHPGGRNEFW